MSNDFNSQKPIRISLPPLAAFALAMGIININPANSTETSTEGNNDTSSYEKDIITIVRAEYAVK
jgi:hypothetical protein